MIIGAGIGGCLAAGRLSRWFEEVIVVERDQLPSTPEPRKGVPQGSHIHGILRRPLDVAQLCFPGFEADLRAAGGIPLRSGDQLRFHDAGAWHPRRDLGVIIYSQTRALLEHTIRSRTRELKNVFFRTDCSLVGYICKSNTIEGAKVKTADGAEEVIQADLFLDSTGRGGNLPASLRALGYSDLQETELGVQICYSSALFSRSKLPEEEIGAYVVRSNPPRTRSGVLFPVENDQWIVSLSGRFDDFPPGDDAGFLEFARSLEDPIIYNVIKGETRTSKYSRFLIPRIYFRRYEQMQRFPDRLIAIGDAVAGFNPVYGQGMAVASLQVMEIDNVVETWAERRQSLNGLSGECLLRVAEATSIAWRMTEPVDLVFDQTTGERPQGFEERIAFSRKVRGAIEDDAELQRTLCRVTNLLEPSAALEAAARRAGLM